MDVELNNIFEQLPDDLSSEVFETLLQSNDIKVQRIISKGQASAPGAWYDQPQAEWVIVLQGEAIVTVEGDKDYHLIAGSHLNIPAHTRHRVKWTMPKLETIWLAIHY